MTTHRLADLVVDESSRVADPANGVPGWLIQKQGPKPRPKADPKIRIPQITEALAARAKTLGVSVAAVRLDRLAQQAYDREEAGDPFSADEWDEELGKTRKASDMAVRLDQLREALAGRFEVITGEAVDPWVLSGVADEAHRAEEAGTKFEASKWDDRLKAEAEFVSKYMGANGAEEVKVPDKTLDERVAEAVEAAAPGDERNRYAVRTVLVKVAHLVQAGLSEPEAVSKAVEQLFGSPAAQATAQVAKELVDRGLSHDEAQMEAGRASMTLNRRRLAERAAAAAVQKTTDPEVAAVAAVFKEWRGKRGLTQEQLAAEVGITARQIAKYEAGQALPQGLNAFRLADVLGFPIEFVREIGRVHHRAPERG